MSSLSTKLKASGLMLEISYCPETKDLQDLRAKGVNLRLTTAAIDDMRERCKGDPAKSQEFETELLVIQGKSVAPVSQTSTLSSRFKL